MKEITNFIMRWVMLLITVASRGNTAILRLENNAFHSYLKLGIALRSDLLDPGDPGEATLEFWIQSTTPGNEWLLTDLNTDEDHWQVRMASEGQLTVSLSTESASLSLTNEVRTNFWHHVALVVSDNAQRLEVYVNAIKRADLNYDLRNNRELYLYKKAGTELLLTEVRGWSDKRTAREIVDNQWRTYASQSQPDLDNLESQGLLIYYGKDAFSNDQPGSDLTLLTRSRWFNAMSGSQEVTVVNSYRGQSLGEMNTNFDHPILSLDQILLTAGKGEEKEKVTLSWLHVKGADRYNIFRDEVSICSLEVDGLKISDPIVYTDDQPLANTLYTYKVKGYNKGDEVFSPQGTDKGFIFPNGEIAGSIVTEGGVDVEGVELRAAAVNGSIPGSALLFDAGSEPVFVPSIEGFRELDAFTLQFWYRSTGSALSGTPFQLGDLSIRFKGSDLQVMQAANVALTAPVSTDQAWHYYTFTFYETGCKIYEDSLLLTSGTQSLLPSLSTVDRFALNASAPSASWRLDELKVWSDTLSHMEIRSRYDHILSGEEENLLLYYRFDLPGTDHIYNQARDTRGAYIGSGSALKWLTDEAPTLVYGGFTQANGSYVVSGIYPGAAADGLNLVVTPDKPNHAFNPTFRHVNLKRSLDAEEYEQTADFTDISSLSVSGRVLYHEGDQVYPVLAGQNILLDGQPVVSTTEDVTTDHSGVYAITSPLGLHTFEVQNTPSARYLGNRSLRLDGGWASTNTVLNGTDQMTFSGWVRRGTYDVAPALQTLLTLGDLKLVLKENDRLAVRNGTDDLLTSQVILSDDFTFFAFTIDKTAAMVTLYVDETYQKESGISGLSDINLTGFLTLGGEGNEGGESDSINPFTGHLDQLEIRTEAYDQEKLKKTIKEGEYLSTDATALWLYYAFNGLVGNRAISPTAEGWDLYLGLHEGAERTGEFSAPYTREYAYDYVASNDAYHPKGPQYKLNIVDVITDLHFENTTRFGVVGNIVIPCDNHVGAWTGTIERTDLTEPPFRREITDEHFNLNTTVFKIDGLLPGSYSIRLSNAADPTQTLESDVIDVSEGWVSVDFEYRNPLTLTTKLYEWNTRLDTVGAPITPLCDGKYELTAGIEYMVMATVTENYAAASCPVEEATVSFDGEMGVLGSGFSFETGADGNVGLVFAASGPNFIGDYTRKLTVTASHDNRNAKSVLTSYNTGLQQQNNNFTIEEPIISMILHDPPGDGSSLEVNTSYSFRQEYTYAAGTEIGLDFGFGSGADTEVLAGVGVIKKIAEVAASVGLGTSSSFTFKTTGGNSVEYTLNQSISTSSDDTFTGLDADVYIGLGTVIQFGTGRSLTVDDCKPVVTNDIEVAKFEDPTPFVYTHQDVKDVLLVQLDSLLKDAIALGDQNKIDDYTNQIGKWESILAENEAKKAAVASLAGFDSKEEKLVGESEVADPNVNFDAIEGIPQNISFSGLARQTYQYIQNNSESEGGIFGRSSGLTRENDTKISALGKNVEFTVKSSIIRLRETTRNNTTTKSGGYSFTFYDDDAGDQFTVDIKKDDRYGTPIFGTNAGQSACPFESGTQPREGVELLVSDTYEVHALAGETAVFELALRNTQLAVDNTPKEYFIKVDQGDNPEGSIVRYNGDPLSNGLSITFDLDDSSSVGVEQEIKGQLTIEAPDHVIGDISYTDIPIVMYSGCEADRFDFLYRQDELAEVSIKVVDTIYLTAHFKSPCVASMDLKAPADQWVINQTDGDILPLQFALPGLTDTETPQYLTEIKVEYAREGNSMPILLKTIPVDTLQESYRTDGYIHYDLDVSDLEDDDYQLRLTPQCGLGQETWRTSNSTEWRTGSIYRSLIIDEVYPPDNAVMTSGTISAIYNRALNPAGVNSLNVSLRGILGGLDYVPVSLELNQPTDYITIPDAAALDLDSAFTIEFWAYPTAFGDVQILKKGSNYGLSLTAQGKINADTDGFSFTSTENLPRLHWTHVAVVYDGLIPGIVKILFDGRDIGHNFSNQPFAFIPNDDSLIIGGGFLGRLDEIRIWNTVRNDAEILTNRTRRLLGNEEGLMAYYVLDDSGLEWVNGQGTVIREAIRDYTGHASYTKAQGISWVEGAQAAPLIVEQVVQDVPIDVTLSEGNRLLLSPKPNFPAYYLEGAVLTAFIADEAIRDVYGNPAAGKSWSFGINTNRVKWAQDNLSLVQAEGTATSFTMNLTNEGATEATYELVDDLPEWLTLTDDPGNGVLLAGFTHTLYFETATRLNPEVHSGHVNLTVYDPDGGRTGLESFYVEVGVQCAAPDYSVSASSYPDQISLKAELFIEGILSKDVNDRVGAYIDGTLRGTGRVTYLNGRYLVEMIIYGNIGENAALTFKVWDASECKEYAGILESYTYNGTPIGSLSNLIPLTTGDVLTKSLSLSEGFHWISMNLKDANSTTLSLTQTSGWSDGDYLIAQNGDSANYNPTSGWSGTLTGLDPKAYYRIKLTQATTLSFSGEVVSENTDIPVTLGTTWVGYLPEQRKRTDRALISLGNTTATNGDRISGKYGQAEFVDGVWVGGLTHLTPGQGYRITLSKKGVLNYYGIADNPNARSLLSTLRLEAPEQKVVEVAAQRGWEVVPTQFPEVMHFSGILAAHNELETTSEVYQIGAFAGMECRGIAVPQKIEGKYHYFMTVHGHHEGESLTFQLVDPATDQTYSLSNEADFLPGTAVGSYRQAYEWTIGAEVAEISTEWTVYPNPFTNEIHLFYPASSAGEVHFVLYDQAGRQIDELIMNEGLSERQGHIIYDATSLQEGMYLYQLQVGETLKNGKLIKE